MLALLLRDVAISCGQRRSIVGVAEHDLRPAVVTRDGRYGNS